MGDPDTSTGAQDMEASRPAPAAVPVQRWRSTLEVRTFLRHAYSRRMNPERRRLTYALLLSLLIHTLLLSLTFGGQGLGLPGFGFPWQDRQVEASDLSVVIVPAQVTAAEPAVTPVAETLQQALVEQPVTSGPALTSSVSRAPTQRQTAAAIVPDADPRAVANPRTDAATTDAAPAKMPLRADRRADTAPAPISAPAVIAVTRTDEATWVVHATPAMPTPVIAAAPSVSIPETAMPSPRDTGDAARARLDQEAGERAVELAKLDSSKQEGQRQAEHMEAARQDVARQEVARAENARLDAERQEAARVEAARVEAARVEAAKVEAAQIEAARVEAAKVEAAQIEAARVEAAGRGRTVEAARVEAARG